MYSWCPRRSLLVIRPLDPCLM
ncbi:hypothetical protein AVEN_31352-1, partial [Araneus ventricosus]